MMVGTVFLVKPSSSGTEDKSNQVMLVKTASKTKKKQSSSKI